MYLIFDTETTGLPRRWDAPITDLDNWPRVVQLAWQLHDEVGGLISREDYLVIPDGYNIPYDAEQVHGISTALAKQQGQPLAKVLQNFEGALAKASLLVGHNASFDVNVLGAEFFRTKGYTPLEKYPVLDTCTEKTADACRLPGGRGGRYKLPNLTELYKHLFFENFEEAHNATADVEATARCFFELIRQEIGFEERAFSKADYFKYFKANNPEPIQLLGITHQNLKEASLAIAMPQKQETSLVDAAALEGVLFSHLHNHTQFSVLQSTCKISELVEAAKSHQMPAIAITDIGNMMGVFEFVKEVERVNKMSEASQHIKPIIGIELFVCENRKNKSAKDNGYQVVFLAKNKNGYHNLCKMSSIAYTEGFYYVPRIDREVVECYKKDIIVLTGNIYGEIPSKLLKVGEKQAEEALLWWKGIFQDDLYIELFDHGEEAEASVLKGLLALSQKHKVKPVATNNVYYIDRVDAEAHDILLCIKDGEKVNTPKGKGRGYRYGLPNQEYYFKSPQEMKSIFSTIPDAIINTSEIVEKIEGFSLNRDVLLPKFKIPDTFSKIGNVEDENGYLRHLTYEGAKGRYAEFSQALTERIDFELEVIQRTGYPGYFLIVQDLVAEAKKMGVSVGPGRGSAAGSVVAYCLGITNIDPIAYDLLFERFLNPDRVSLPDIDIDFDDEGRAKVLNYVTETYGSSQVAQIITYGTMAGRSAIRDTARVLDLPLSQADMLAKLIPSTVSLSTVFSSDDSKLRSSLRQDDYNRVLELKKLAKDEGSLTARTLKKATQLEGSLRNIGKHACGVIITPQEITNLVPIATAKEADLYVTQFDNSVVESAGLLKMDFLGLSTLTLIRDTVNLVKKRRGHPLDMDAIPLDDIKTYELFQRGETVGIFQYESDGMQKYMKDLKPTVFADLIAINALYRPGPLEYIPSFIRRKHGLEPIVYDLEACEEFLKETYGITVYQEQVMLLSQKLSGFTKGEADLLRKAMGKKQIDLLQKLKPKFLDGGAKNNHPEQALEKIWKDWEAFASYAFNKSHATCYAYIGYQTAYLKANYPQEYMAAVLSNNMNNIDKQSFFLKECKRMKISVLIPDVNESEFKFTVNKNGDIRFGMGAVKGVGKAVVDAIVEGRKDKPYTSIFDMAKRIDHSAVNKKAIESLVLAGAMDAFGKTHRAQYLQVSDGVTFFERALKFGVKFRNDIASSQTNLFGSSETTMVAEPTIPECEEWTIADKLEKEKEVIGMFVSRHPLDDYKLEIDAFTNKTLDALKYLESFKKGEELRFVGIVSSAENKTSQKGNFWGSYTLQDYSSSYQIRIFGNDYVSFSPFFIKNEFLYITAKVVKGYKDSELELKILEVDALKTVLEKRAKAISIQFELENLNETMADELKTILDKHKGTKKVDFRLYSSAHNLDVKAQSLKQGVSISKTLLEDLQAQGYAYKLNG